MHHRRQARAIAVTRSRSHGNFRPFLALGFGLLLMMAAVAARADETIIKSHGISTFGDLKYPADFEHLDYVNPDAPKGGEISIWGFGSFDSMNPYTTVGRAGQLSTVFYESLLTGTSDEVGSSYGMLAESLEYPEDRSWVIFNIRPEARFSDGSDLTAEDVIFTFNLFMEKGLPDFRFVFSKQVKSAEALDTYRVKFTFQDEFPKRDLPQLVGGLPIFSKAHYEANNRDLEASSLDPFLGSGPYVLGRMDVGKTLVYTRNPDYWGKDLPINRGVNNFDAIRVEYYADYNAAFEGFKAGNYTFRNEASSKIWATGYDFPAIEKGWAIKTEFHDGDIASGQAFAINMRRPQFQDPKVREALGLMFNFEWSNEKLFYGIYSRVNSFWENSELAATGLPSEAELALLRPLAEHLPDGVLDGPPVDAPTSGEKQFDRSNLQLASQLLDEAGWPLAPPPLIPPVLGGAAMGGVAVLILLAAGGLAYTRNSTSGRALSAVAGVVAVAAVYVLLGTPTQPEDDGMRRNAQGTTLRVEFLNDSQTFDRVINPYVENLRQLGVDAVHERVDNAQAVNRERSYDFDLATTHFPMDFIPGSELEQFFGSETAQTSTRNMMGLEDPAVDALIDHVLAAKNKEELHVAVKAMDRVLRAKRFWIPQWFKETYTVAYYDMYDYPETLPPYSLGHLDIWWYNAEKAEKLKAAGAF